MPTTILKNQITSWLREQDYWLQFAGNKLLEGEALDQELQDCTFNLFCEEYEMKTSTIERTPVNFSELEESEQATAGDLKLLAIGNLSHVNALQSGQTIPIGPNLTIVYGGNGAGKTGYIRMLNNAFVARGDKQILQNIYDPRAAGEPEGTFTFQSGDEAPFELRYPEHKDRPEFSHFSVFDSVAARVQIESDNRLNFTPAGFQFFDQLVELFDGLKGKLNSLIRANRPANNFAQLFGNENNIREAMVNLGGESNEEELQRLGTFSAEQETRRTELVAQIGQLHALNVPRKVQELQTLSGQYALFIAQQQSILDCLTPASIETYRGMIESYHGFQKLISEEGIKQLEPYGIEKLGSPEWKEFIKAARGYAASVEVGRTAYPSDGDHCLLCLQPLQEKETNLIKAYWTLLSSQAENELAQTIQKIRTALQKLRGLPVLSFVEGQPVFDHTRIQNPVLAERWKILVPEIEQARQQGISNLSNCNSEMEFQSYEIASTELQPLKAALDEEAHRLMRTNPQQQIQTLQHELNFLTDKELLSRMINDVLIYVRSHKWASKAEGCLSAFRTNAITTKQGILFNEHISERFTSTFTSECSALNAPTVVEIVQRNVKMSTLRKLQVAGEVANRILSEGEQRSISLADFLTETQLNPRNKGVIFDDPVNSLDHERKELIAKRLVELGTKRQVVVFTHELSFLIQLRIQAENKDGFDLSLVSIRRSGLDAGIVLQDTPWIGMTVKARIGHLKNRLVAVKKIARDGTEEEYRDAAKSWHLYLREAWERAVEERLFKGVVERFGFGIQTQKLAKVEVTPVLLDDIEKGMTESSKWVHDTAAGLNPPIPTPDKLQADLDFFEAFSGKCKAP